MSSGSRNIVLCMLCSSHQKWRLAHNLLIVSTNLPLIILYSYLIFIVPILGHTCLFHGQIHRENHRYWLPIQYCSTLQHSQEAGEAPVQLALQFMVLGSDIIIGRRATQNSPSSLGKSGNIKRGGLTGKEEGHDGDKGLRKKDQRITTPRTSGYMQKYTRT